jgi:nucleotide-binding universal stress UspA family protein
MRSMSPRTVVLATDFSELSKRIYGPVAELAAELDADLTLLHVVPELRQPLPGVPFGGETAAPEVTAEIDAARRRIADHAGRITGAPVKTIVESGASVAETIARIAHERGAILLALSTHGHSGFRQVVLGSVAEAVLRQARTPVLCFPRGCVPDLAG